jgi:hypothetical protein
MATAIIAPQAIKEINGVSIFRHHARIRKIKPSRIAISMAWVVAVSCDSTVEFITACSLRLPREQAYTDRTLSVERIFSGGFFF